MERPGIMKLSSRLCCDIFDVMSLGLRARIHSGLLFPVQVLSDCKLCIAPIHFLTFFFTTLTVRILGCHYDHWIHHATTVSHTLENLQDVVGVHDGCPGACRQSRRRTGRRGSADELIAPLTTSDLLFCRFPHNNTMPYTS